MKGGGPTDTTDLEQHLTKKINDLSEIHTQLHEIIEFLNLNFESILRIQRQSVVQAEQRRNAAEQRNNAIAKAILDAGY